MTQLHLKLDVRSHRRHELLVELQWSGEELGELFLPTWTPGSYLIREYARFVDHVRAEDLSTGEPIDIRRTAKNRWRVADASRNVRVSYSVHAHELSVRTNHAVDGHAYWNGAPTFLWPADHKGLPAELTVQLPRDWDLAIALEEISRTSRDDGGTDVCFAVRNHDQLIDSPGLAGPLAWDAFEVDGIPHRIASVGQGPFDGVGRSDGVAAMKTPLSDAASQSGRNPDVAQDAAKLVKAAKQVFGKLPYSSYLFQILFTGRGGGGLEHMDSTTLMAPRTWLAQGGRRTELLGLIAHEHFHAWNVKRMRPKEFWTYDYEVENRTRLLWVAEGFTAYYDDLLCMRAGLVPEVDYLARLAANVRAMLRGGGRHVQSLEEASEDAWLRLYRPDPNNVNTTQNYYGNGAVVAWLMDLTILAATEGQRRLDDAMRKLYHATYSEGRGYGFEDVCRALSAAAGIDLTSRLRPLVASSLDPDFDSILRPCGLVLATEPSQGPALGADLKPGTTKLDRVRALGSAQTAGLANEDEILALDGLRTTSDNFDAIWKTAVDGTGEVGVLYARNGLVQSTTMEPAPDPYQKVTIRRDAAAPDAAKQLADAWLRTEG